MNSFIYIDGIVLWVCVGVFLLFLFTFVIVACAYMKVEKDNYVSKEKNKKLRAKLSITQDKLYKATFKVPGVDEDYEEKFSIDELGGTKDV